MNSKFLRLFCSLENLYRSLKEGDWRCLIAIKGGLGFRTLQHKQKIESINEIELY